MRKLFFLFVIIFLISCSHEKSTISNFEFYPETFATSEDSFYNQKITHLTSIYNLQTLKKGTYDSLVIRIWPWEAFEPFNTMFEFRLDSGRWKGYHYCSYTVFTGEGFVYMKGHETLGDSVFIVKHIIPKCGWDKFLDSLNSFQLRTLPTQSLIKNFEHQIIFDGDGVQFEIATKKSYRWINYSNPSSYTYKECQQLENFMNMFRRQFANDYSWPINKDP